MHAAGEREGEAGGTSHSQVLLGIIAIAAGVLLLIERLDIADVRIGSDLWPFLPLTLGVLRILDPPVHRGKDPGARRSGAWLLFVGCWGLANEHRLWALDYSTSWPLFIVFTGVLIVWRAVDASGASVPRGDRGR